MKLRQFIDQEQLSPQFIQQQKAHVEHVVQYYEFLKLLKVTQSFSTDPPLYEEVNLTKFAGRIALVGSMTVLELEPPQGLPKTGFYPVVECLSEHEISLNSWLQNKALKLRLKYEPEEYRKPQNVKTYNKVIKSCLKDKEVRFIFTHLQVQVQNQRLFFLPTQDTKIQQVPIMTFFSYFLPLQTSMLYNYADIVIQSQKETQKLTYLLQDARNFLQSRYKGRMVLLGVVKEIEWNSGSKKQQGNLSEAQITLRQDVVSKKFSTFGVCKVLVRWRTDEEKQIKSFLEKGWIYSMQIFDVFLNNKVELGFKIKDLSKDVVKITQAPLFSKDTIFKQIQVSTLNILETKDILRNHYRFTVYKLSVKKISAKVVCQKCGLRPYRAGEEKYECRKEECGVVNGKLYTWAIVEAADSHGFCRLHLKDETMLNYFGLEGQAADIKDQILKEQVQNQMEIVTLYPYKDHQNHGNWKSFDKAYSNNEYLQKLIHQCLLMSVCKSIIAVPKAQPESFIFSMSQEQKLELMSSSIGQNNEMTRSVPIFMNGGVRDGKLVPSLTVLEVFDAPYW